MAPNGFVSKSQKPLMNTPIWEASEHLGGSRNLKNKPDKHIERTSNFRAVVLTHGRFLRGQLAMPGDMG